MGLDLTLLPLRDPRDLGETIVGCYDRLSFDSDYAIFEQLTDVSGEGVVDPPIKATVIPPQLWIRLYGDEGINEVREDSYLKPLTFVYAEQLRKLQLPDDASAKNKAILAFVNALHPYTPIILWWR